MLCTDRQTENAVPSVTIDKCASATRTKTCIAVQYISEETMWLREKVSHLKGMPFVNKEPSAYVCKNFACSLPVQTAQELGQTLKA